MVIFPLMNNKTLIIYTSTTEKPCRTNQIPAVSGDCQMFQVNFVPSLVADRKTAVWFFVENNLSFCVLSVRTRPQPCSSWTVHNTYVMGNRRRNMATKLRTDRSRETLWQIIIRGKSVLYFKSSGKVKNKWPVGRPLWILFESIWLKIKVIVCIIIVAWNSYSPAGVQIWKSGRQCKIFSRIGDLKSAISDPD